MPVRSLVDADVAETCRIESGRPVFGKDMTEDTIPLEAGIEDRAISLTKGCYVGQEIIIRVLAPRSGTRGAPPRRSDVRSDRGRAGQRFGDP